MLRVLAAEVRQGAEAGPSDAGPSSGVEARFGPPNQLGTAAIQACLQTGLRHHPLLPQSSTVCPALLFFGKLTTDGAAEVALAKQ